MAPGMDLETHLNRNKKIERWSQVILILDYNQSDGDIRFDELMNFPYDKIMKRLEKVDGEFKL